MKSHLKKQVNEWINERTDNNFCTLEKSSKVKKHSLYKKQKFIIFNKYAYDKTRVEWIYKGKKCFAVPLKFDGHYYYYNEDGILSLIKGPDGFYVDSFNYGWLFTHELTKTNREIIDYTMEMLDRGLL